MDPYLVAVSRPKSAMAVDKILMVWEMTVVGFNDLPFKNRDNEVSPTQLYFPTGLFKIRGLFVRLRHTRTLLPN